MLEKIKSLAGFITQRKKYFLLFISSYLCFAAIAQHHDTLVQTPVVDTPRKSLVERVQKIGTDEARASIQTYKQGRIAIQQGILLEEIKKVNQQLKIFLKNGIDTPGVKRELRKAKASLAIVGDGVLVNKGTHQAQRNLSVSSAVTLELLNVMTDQKEELDSYAAALIHYKDKIDSLSSDTMLYSFPPDSLKIINYMHRLQVVAAELKPVDSISKKALVDVEDLQIKVDLLVNQLRFTLEDIELYRKDASARTFNREFANIWGPVGFTRSIGDIFRFSIAKEKLAFNFYIEDKLGQIFVLIVIWFICFVFLRSLKRESQLRSMLVSGYKGQLVIRYPALSAIVIVVGIFQFLFAKPPFIFDFSLWLISAICLSIMLSGVADKSWLRFWYIMFILFVVAALDNFILQASRSERWVMLFLSLGGVIYSCKILLSKHGRVLQEKSILYFVAFVAVFETLSVIFNVFGRYNLSKAFFVSGYTGVMIAVQLLWTARLINEGLFLASQIYKRPDKKLFYINFDKVGEKVPKIFYVLLVIGWVIMIGRNFYVFNKISEPLGDFLTSERTLGAYSFSVKGLFIFLLILFTSLFLSRIISFFTSDANSVQTTEAKKAGRVTLGSWMLLVRIFIISMGVFLAFAAAGIPLDRITIIIGALGVGIGLGLQGLVHNLVSGLIIAFEKPVNVGDVIEVGGKLATMKSIGFRSSIISMSDGAAVIIPNGDLLSEHLVNWSMAKQMKKISVVVGVAYGSDLNKVKNLLDGILKSTDNILAYPSASILAKEFNHGAIDFELSFWVNHISEWGKIKSEVISKIDAVFAKEGIVIPLPKEEIYIHNLRDALPPAKE